jgi:hypothetical protein
MGSSNRVGSVVIVLKQHHMKTIKPLFILSLAVALASCTQNNPLPTPSSTGLQVPNGSFEYWNSQLPIAWQTNSCPACVPAFETYIVQQDTDAYDGQYAAKFIYNNQYVATAVNGFDIGRHPQYLKAWVKGNIVPNDSVYIGVRLYLNNVQVDYGYGFVSSSIANYTQIQIPISQTSAQADSAAINIEGGHINAYPANNSEFWIDAVTLE